MYEYYFTAFSLSILKSDSSSDTGWGSQNQSSNTQGYLDATWECFVRDVTATLAKNNANAQVSVNKILNKNHF